VRILVLSQRYHPEPSLKASELAEGMSQRGHSVTVLTGFPHYPGSRIYANYRLRLVRKETVSGVLVIRTFIFPYHGRSVVGRILNYGSFVVSSFLGAWLAPPCDVIYVWHPPLTVGIAAWLIARLKGCGFVYDVQDVWPDSVVWSGMLHNRFLIWFLQGMENFVYGRAKHLLVVSEEAKRNLASKGVPRQKITVARHWVDEGLFAAESAENRARIRDRYGFGRHFVVMFAGNLGLVQGLDTVLHAAAMLKTLAAKVLIVFVGEGADRERLAKLAAGLQLANVLFLGRQPAAAMPGLMAAADALLVHLRRGPLAELCIPTKTMAYLAAGRPIMMATTGPAARLVTDARAGRALEPDEPGALAGEILRMSRMPAGEREQMGRNGRSYLMAHYAKQDVLSEYEAVLAECCPPRREGGAAEAPHRVMG